MHSLICPQEMVFFGIAVSEPEDSNGGKKTILVHPKLDLFLDIFGALIFKNGIEYSYQL